jgi:hypothetical protein
MNAYKLQELNRLMYSGTVSMHKHRQAAFPKPLLETGVKNLEFVSTPR